MSNSYIDALIIFGSGFTGPDHLFKASTILSTRQTPKGPALEEVIRAIQRDLTARIVNSVIQDSRFFRRSEESADCTMAVKLDAVVLSIEELERLLTAAYNKGFDRGASGS